jgi:hypothetical protein
LKDGQAKVTDYFEEEKSEVPNVFESEVSK